MAKDKTKHFDSSDPAQSADRNAVVQGWEARRIAGLTKIMNDPECRLWMHDLMAFCGVSRIAYHGESTHDTSFKLGHQNVGFKLQADITKHCRKQYLVMLDEGDIRQKTSTGDKDVSTTDG